jgi:hypothetical protein
MTVPAERRPWGKIDAHLDDLASGDAEIVPQEIGALDSRLLHLRRVQCETACDQQHSLRNDSRRFHVDFLSFFKQKLDDQCPGRSDLKAARSSAAKSSGCSHAAKYPPLSTSWK